uniref:Ras-GEF domain-containing protein n=1 Tax=Equus caballus TaxID=9796 RepID=A0A9L0TLD9_HORSE
GLQDACPPGRHDAEALRVCAASLPQQSPLQCHHLPLQGLRLQHSPPGAGPAVSQVPSTLRPGRCPHPLWDTWRQLGPLRAGCWRTGPPPKCYLFPAGNLAGPRAGLQGAPAVFSWTLQLATLHVSFGGSHVEGHAYLLPGHLEHLKAIEAERKEPAPKLLPLPEPEPVPAPGLEPAAPPVSPRVVELEPAAPESATPGPEQGPPLEAAPEPSCPCAVTTEDQLREEKLNILDFPPQLVAEQLTRMAAELFKTLVPAHCLGSIWSERDNRERESLAPTVRDTVMHDNTVANCILVTCLGDASMTAQDRARVVELWIRVAEGEFSNLEEVGQERETREQGAASAGGDLHVKDCREGPPGSPGEAVAAGCRPLPGDVLPFPGAAGCYDGGLCGGQCAQLSEME